MARYATLLACAASCLATAAAAGSGWTVTDATGPVQVLHSGISRVVAKGGVLETGDTIQTGRSGRAVVTRGEDYLVVAPNSRLRIAPPPAPGGLVQILEDFGNVVFKIKKLGVPHFGVQTPYLAAVVKGTTFSVTVTDKGASVQVTEGAVQVATVDGGASELVRPGMIAIVSRADSNRLDIRGDTTKTIVSPTAVANPGSEQAVPPHGEAAETRISAVMSDDNGQLSRETGGLISGSATPALALAAAYAGRNAQMPSAPVPASSTGVSGSVASNAAAPPADASGTSGTGGGTGANTGAGATDAGAGSGTGSGNANSGSAGPSTGSSGSGSAAAGSASGNSNANNSGNGAATGGSNGNSSNAGNGNNGNGHGHGNNGNGKGNNGNGNGNGGPNGSKDDGKGDKHGPKSK